MGRTHSGEKPALVVSAKSGMEFSMFSGAASQTLMRRAIHSGNITSRKLSKHLDKIAPAYWEKL
jgi:hypothetical protein